MDPIVPIFAVHYTYSDPAAAAGRDAVRPEHRAWLTSLIAAGSLLSTGPYPDGSGGLLLFQTPDEATVQALLAQDPFVGGKLVDAVRVVEWKPVMGAFSS